MRFRLFVLMLIFALAPFAAGALNADLFEEGTDYVKLERPGEPDTEQGVEIIEFFSYGCGHCADLEPHLNQWRENGKPSDATLIRIPVAWSQGFEALARVYYTADILGVPEEAHEGFFNLIHVDRAQLSLPMIAEFFAKHGAEQQAFIETFGSPAVTQRVSYAKTKTRQYQVTGVPVFVVDGAYKVPTSAAGFPRMLETVSYVAESLVGKAED